MAYVTNQLGWFQRGSVVVWIAWRVGEGSEVVALSAAALAALFWIAPRGPETSQPQGQSWTRRLEAVLALSLTSLIDQVDPLACGGFYWRELDLKQVVGGNAANGRWKGGRCCNFDQVRSHSPLLFQQDPLLIHCCREDQAIWTIPVGKRRIRFTRRELS